MQRGVSLFISSSLFLPAILLIFSIHLLCPCSASGNPEPSPAGISQTPASTVADDDIRDIYGPVRTSLLPGAMRLLPIVACLCAAAGVIFLLYRASMRPSPLPARSPESIAFEALEAARMLMHTDLSREFAFTITSILRQFIHDRFGTPVTSETSEEFLHRISRENDSPLQSQIHLLTDFLSLCDCAKFGKASYPSDILTRLHSAAIQFVTACTELPTPSAVTGEAGSK